MNARQYRTVEVYMTPLAAQIANLVDSALQAREAHVAELETQLAEVRAVCRTLLSTQKDLLAKITLLDASQDRKEVKP